MKKVFISYSHKDEEMANKLHDLLKHARIEVFFDKDAIEWATKWEDKLNEGLKSSQYLITCLSPTYLESDWCRKEFQHFQEKYEQGKRDKKEQNVKIMPIMFKECDNAVPQFLKELQYLDVSTEKKLHAHSFEIYRRLDVWPPSHDSNTNRNIRNILKKSLKKRFVGRSEEIWRIYDVLRDHESGVCILTGIGGVGKTQLAIEYASRFCELYSGGLIWINAEFDPSHSDLDIEAQIQNQVEDNIKKQITKQLLKEENLRDLLDIIRGTNPLLIIFDNFPEEADIDRYIRHMGSGIFSILTTRRIIGENYAFQVNSMNIEDSIELLNSGKRKFGKEANKLVEKLGGLPLALELARGYLNNTVKSIDEMITKIDNEGEMGSCKDFEDRHRESLPHHIKSVAATFKISYDQIVSPTDRDILHCLCLMEPIDVPKEILEEVLFIDRKAADQTLTDSISNLSKTWGILDTDDNQNPVVHRLIIAYVRLRLQERTGLFEHFVNIIVSTLDKKISAILNGKGELKQDVLLKLLPHAEGICGGELIDKGLAAHILCKLGRIREMLGNKSKAVKNLQMAVKKASIAEDYLLHAKASSYLGVSMFHEGDYIGSIENLDSAKETYNDFYKNGGLDINDLVAYGTCLDYIGEYHREQGEFNNAEEFHKKAIKIAQSIPDKRLKSVEAHAKAQIGAIYLRKKEYEKTIEHWGESLEISKEIDDKPWIAHFNIDVGFVHLLNRNYLEASRHLNKGINAAEKGGYKDNIARGTMNLASVYFVQGEMRRAENAYKEALPIAEKNYVVRLVWRIEYNLGNVFRAKGDYQKAKEYYSIALKHLEKLRENYSKEEEKKKFMEHRLRPYKTMILLAIERDNGESSAKMMIDDSESAMHFVEKGMHESLAEFYKEVKEKMELDKECENDKNFFIVNNKGYYVETE
jgi:tetratricopeptide (TPR) repeat protein